MPKLFIRIALLTSRIMVGLHSDARGSVQRGGDSERERAGDRVRLLRPRPGLVRGLLLQHAVDRGALRGEPGAIGAGSGVLGIGHPHSDRAGQARQGHRQRRAVDGRIAERLGRVSASVDEMRDEMIAMNTASEDLSTVAAAQT